MGDAICIADAVRKLGNLIGIGTDNATVMTGSKQSVYTELKKSVPSLQLIRCVCHSVQLAVNKACTKALPQSLEFLVHETYSWFSKSSSRQLNYRKLYKCLNNEQVLIHMYIYMFILTRSTKFNIKMFSVSFVCFDYLDNIVLWICLYCYMFVPKLNMN